MNHMFDYFNYDEFMGNQLKYFSNIVFFITFGLIFTSSRSNIVPLNIIVFCCSIILYHVYPNYYQVVNHENSNFTPFLVIYDFITHYLPLIYVLSANIHNSTNIDYKLCGLIIVSYFIVFRGEDFYKLYFEPGNYFK